MTPPRNPRPDDPNGLSRRTFLHTGSAALAIGSGALAGATPKAARADDNEGAGGEAHADPEWRNKVDGMAYRRLGRTNLMISEFVAGGDPIVPDNYKHMLKAIERGLNYLDMAPGYHDGDTERAFGTLLKEPSVGRDKVFLATKVSAFNRVRNGLYKEIFEGLPESKQDELVEAANALMEARGVKKPGYLLTYFPGQPGSFDPSYLLIVMTPEFGERVAEREELRETIIESVDGSLRRLATDHVDILMCPHGADSPEDLDSPAIRETFELLKRQGKARFLGVSSHNDPAGVLHEAARLGHYDMAMVAYNVVNGGYLDSAIRRAAEEDMGLVAMKSAMAVATHHEPLQPVPEWRIEMVNRIVPGDEKPPLKAYLWSLQNPRIAAVISNLWDETYIEENLAMAGKKVELQPA
jgi:aryl-alcohol dehydrogenase-like predicted oxidoreductase